MKNLKFEISAITNKGSYRKQNEDNFFINNCFLSDTMVDKGMKISKTLCFPFVAGVSDGMGGEKSGKAASMTIAENFYGYVSDNAFCDAKDALKESIKNINIKVCESFPDSGATLSAVFANGKKITAASIGDSKIYLYKNDVLRQMSTDHTLAQMQADAGLLSKEQAKESKLRHVLTQHIGIPPFEMVIEPDIFEIEDITSDDAILICSDGFADSIEETDIENIFSLYSDASSAAEKLMACALKNEKKDNLTVMVIKATGG